MIKHPPDLTGLTYNNLKVLKFVERREKQQQKYYLCQCLCEKGTLKEVSHGNLISNQVKSCGCLKSGHIKHGQAKGPGQISREFYSWQDAKARCFRPTKRNYKDYGGRGITMCDMWIHDFAAFYDHIGPCPEGLTLDRIDVNGNYEPGNVRWATLEEQSQNRRSTKTTKEEVELLRNEHAAGATTMSLASKYNLPYQLVLNVILRRTWKNIKEDEPAYTLTPNEQ